MIWTVARSRLHLRGWLERERTYSDKKFPDKQNQKDQSDDHWLQCVNNYIGRALQFGLETPRGRQQLAKAILTQMDWLETRITQYGALPPGGQPS